ncbi:MAG: hypothetical protein OQK52_11700 [Ignavibacteriaceae bacterium]|nr:hypothetical protein [Ignavibacteriaceae bacterium]
MKKKNLKFIVPLIVALIVLTIIKIVEPEEIDWSKSFAKKDKIPYGGYIVYDIAPGLFPDNEFELKELPIYNILKDKYYHNTNYVFINTFFSPDKLDTEYLLDYVAEGNNVFISAFGIYGNLADSLKIKTFDMFFSEDSVNINFTLADLKSDTGYSYFTGNFENYFSEFDTALVQVLGRNGNENVNFLRIKYGDGNFLLNTVPLAFTNYHLLKSTNNEYVYKALSHLPSQKTLWDDYYKDGNKYSATTLQYILSQRALKWAYFIMLVSVFLFIFFYGRRKQRIIPMISPLTNTTLEFVETVGSLYYQQKDYKNIAEKKFSYFLDYIRNKYSVKTSTIDEETIRIISEKSTLSVTKLKSLIKEIERIKHSLKISEEDLININYKIEKFYERTR